MKTSILKNTLAGLAEGMGITEVPKKLATNETALERLTFQHISFLLFYGHKFESNTVNPVIKSLILEWMDLTGCDDVLVDTCYQWREFYHCVILGGKKSNGISDFKRGGKKAAAVSVEKTTN